MRSTASGSARPIARPIAWDQDQPFTIFRRQWSLRIALFEQFREGVTVPTTEDPLIEPCDEANLLWSGLHCDFRSLDGCLVVGGVDF